jgi:hypothetical protein
LIFRAFIPTVLTLAIALPAGADCVQAQDPQAPAQPPAAEEQVEVTEELLERFVDVYPQVLEASQQAQAELATTTDPEQAQAIQARAEDTIMTVLEEEEMSPAEYQAVVYALRDDEELRERFMVMLQEAQDDPGAAPGA